MKKIALPIAQGILCPHFGHCEYFRVFEINEGQITQVIDLPSPPHQPGLLPRWLGEKGITHVLAGGMGQKAISLFQQQQIEVLVGVAPGNPEAILKEYLEGALEVRSNACDH